MINEETAAAWGKKAGVNNEVQIEESRRDLKAKRKAVKLIRWRADLRMPYQAALR